MNTFAVVCCLKSPPDSFVRKEWPLHVTIARPFQTDLSAEQVAEKLDGLYSRTLQIEATGKSREMFGPDKNISVTELESTQPLRELHEASELLLDPFVTRSGPSLSFRPHVTDHAPGPFGVGEKARLSSISLVDMTSEIRYIRHTWTLH